MRENSTMKLKDETRPVILVRRQVLGESAYVMSVNGQSIVFGTLEDMLYRVARYMEPVSEAGPKPPKNGKPANRSNNLGMTKWVFDNLKAPMTTKEMFALAKKGGYPSTTPGSVYSSLWNLRKRGVVVLDKDTEKWRRAK